MPTLLMFCPCEKVIINEDDNCASLITILEKVNLSPLSDMALAVDALAPLRWSVLTLWQAHPEDRGSQYEQRIQLFSPNGNLATEGINQFQMADSRHRNIVNIIGFPIGQEGECILKLSLRKVDEPAEWSPIAEYTIAVQHNRYA